MTTMEDLDLEQEKGADRQAPEVEIRGDEAVIRITARDTLEERKVKLPKTTWG